VSDLFRIFTEIVSYTVLNTYVIIVICIGEYHYTRIYLQIYVYKCVILWSCIISYPLSVGGEGSCGEPLYDFFGGGQSRVCGVEEGVAAHWYKTLFKIAYLE